MLAEVNECYVLEVGLNTVWDEFIDNEPEGRVLQTALFNCFVNSS